MSRDPALVEALASDWRGATLDDRMRALLEYADVLTRTPAAAGPADLQPLRDAGLDDEAIVHLVEVIAYFNYVNRLADGLGVDIE